MPEPAATGSKPSPKQGWVAPRVAGEFPGLAITWIEVDGCARRSPEPVRQRLRLLSDRFFGAHAVHMRERPIPWAYRVFFRQIGLDPDTTRTPIEQLALDRLQAGAFKSRGLPADALTIATVETGVALRAFDAGGVQGGLCIRGSAPGESLSHANRELPHGTLVLADDQAPLSLLFGEADQVHRHPVQADTRRIAVAAIQVKGVPQIAVDEALWIVAATLDGGSAAGEPKTGHEDHFSATED